MRKENFDFNMHNDESVFGLNWESIKKQFYKIRIVAKSCIILEFKAFKHIL